MQTVKIIKFQRWTHFNEYEGAILFNLNGRELWGRIILNPDDWLKLELRKEYQVCIELEQSEEFSNNPSQEFLCELIPIDISRWPPGSEFYFAQSGIHYKVAGVIKDIHEDHLQIDCGFEFEINQDPPNLRSVGEYINTIGYFDIDLNP